MYYIKCSCGEGAPNTWYFDEHNKATAYKAAEMHSMLDNAKSRHITGVRLIKNHKEIARFQGGEEIYIKFDFQRNKLTS